MNASPVQNVQSTKIDSTTQLSWDSNHPCAMANHFLGFSIWRKVDGMQFQTDTCMQGLAGMGYTQIANQIQGYQFVDSVFENGTKDYCYRVLAEFGSESNTGYIYNIARSIPSNETCQQQSYISNTSFETIADGNIKIYPNPAGDFFTIQLENGISNIEEITLIDISGKEIFSKTFADGYQLSNERISTGQIPSGTYFIQLQTKESRVVKKLIIQH